MIRIVTDSSADIPKKEAAQIGVDVVELSVRFPDLAYNQAEDPDFSRFYELLKKTKGFPTTSQPAPADFQWIFEEAKAAGDTVVAILISKGMSGTFQSAEIARQAVGYPDIHLIDSRAAIMPVRILVEYALSLRAAGESVQGLLQKVEAVRDRVKVYGLLDTLTYLHKGGRLPKTVALAGNMLGIKPIVTTKDGQIALAGRGRNALALLSRLEIDGFDPEFPVYFGYSADDTNCLKLMKQASEQFPIRKTGMFPIGSIVGAHIGPGGNAISFVRKDA